MDRVLAIILAGGRGERLSILSNSTVGSYSVVEHSILDEKVVVEAGCHLGFGDDLLVNRREPEVLNTGITLIGNKAKIPPGIRIGCNCVICCGVEEEDFLSTKIQSGETVRLRQRGRARRA